MFMKKFLASYSEKNREPFNEALFIRSEDAIIEDIKKIILSVAKDDNSNLVIRVNYFNVIKDYREVKKILYELESENKRRNKRIDYNIHDYINLKDSDIILLEVNYHLEVNGGILDESVYIDIPKVINKYYFRIAGTTYSTLYQIADASTYNNAQSKKKDRCVSFRQEFLKYVIYEKKGKLYMLDFSDEKENKIIEVRCINYTTDLFGNNIPVCKYFLAEYGFVRAMQYLHLSDIYLTINEPYIPGNHFICFVKDNVYLSLPFHLWDNCPVTQSFVYTIMTNVPKKCDNIEKVFSKDYWLMMLGADFKNKSVEKGQSMLDSTSRNYSYIIRDELRVPEEDKRTLIDVLRWQVYEFNALWDKDNYDMTYKKLRISSYIAGFYAAKLARNLVKAVNGLNSLTVEKLYKTLNINHDFILDSLKKSNLVSYKNSVNDDDIFSVLKYTFKGVSGIGENKASAVPVKYRLANPSHIGKVDCDTSPAGDPGMTGLICPYAELYPGNYLAEYKEPCNWREIQDSVIDEYRKIYSMNSIFKSKEELMGTSEGRELLESIEIKVKNLLEHTVGNDAEI